MRLPGSPAQPFLNGMQPGRPVASPTAAAPPDGSGEPPAEPLAEHPTLVKIREIRRAEWGRHFLCWHAGSSRQVHVRLVPRPRRSRDAEGLTDQLLDHKMCSGHPHVVTLLDVCIEPRTVAIVTESVDTGTLADLLSSKGAAAGSPAALPEERVRTVMQQLLTAVDYCHRLGIALYNMRLDNILVSDNPERPMVKLCDFGTSFSAPAEEDGGGEDGPAAPFLPYLGPEFICNDRELDMEADVYSCGVILYALLSGGRFPFQRSGEEASMSTGLRMCQEKWRAVAGWITPLPQVSPACWHLVKAMLRAEIGDRPNVAEVLRHPWMLVDIPPELAALNDRLVQQHGGNGGAPASRGAVAEVITASILGGDRGSGQPAFSVRAS